MALESFEKQPYEEITIAGDFESVMASTEALVLATSTVTATDKNGSDVSSTVLDQSTKAIGDSPDGGTSNALKMRCRAGSESLSPYKLSYRGVTSTGDKWEIDIRMKIKET